MKRYIAISLLGILFNMRMLIRISHASTFFCLFPAYIYTKILLSDGMINQDRDTVCDLVFQNHFHLCHMAYALQCLFDINSCPSFVMAQAVRLTKFDYRLANRLETDFQKLRCRVNYHALKFTSPILDMGKLLVQRMRAMGKHFIALHLR